MKKKEKEGTVKCADCGKELESDLPHVSPVDLRPLCDYCGERDIPYPFLDPKVREIVREINKFACITQGSCQGHPEDPTRDASCIISMKPTNRAKFHKQVHEILVGFRQKSKAQLSFTEHKFINEARHRDWLCYLELNAGGETFSEKCKLLDQARHTFLQILHQTNAQSSSTKK